jgi:hypothetical protein
MLRNRVRPTLLVLLIALLVSCGDTSLFMSPKTDTTDLQITSASDGQVFASGKTLPLMISAQDASKSRDVEIEITLVSPTGESLWHNRAAATLNEQSPIKLPDGLAAGQYRVDLVLYSAGEIAQKKSITFFVASDGWKITGIRSFPPVITTAATVMLKAELSVPDGANPYLRWTWKGKVIQKGLLSAGLGQILWDAPGEGGVYTITLELFPSAPAAGSDFPFTSSLSLSTDIVVSGAAGTAVRGRLGPPASFSSLLPLQGSLADIGAGAKRAGKLKALPIGSPEVVTLEKGFGYRLDGSSGIRINWLPIPTDGGSLRPFTISLGVSLEDPGSAKNIVTAASADGSFSLVISMNPQTSAPQAVISGTGSAPVSLQWNGPALSPKKRVLLSLSVVPQTAGISVQWFLDGTQVSSQSVNYSPAAVNQNGTLTVGGELGFKGVVDEFGVYIQDAAGRPSTDPDLYARAQAEEYGTRVMIADGFDGITVSSGFAIEGKGQLASGSVDLGPGARLALPPLRTDLAVTVTVDLSPDSSRGANLLAQWEGSAAPATVVPVTADANGFEFRVSSGGLSIAVPAPGGEKTVNLPSPGSSGATLLLKLENPRDAKLDLVLESVLALSARQ